MSLDSTAATSARTSGASTSPFPVIALEPTSGEHRLLSEIQSFGQDYRRRYTFNNRWDVVLSIIGILLSIAVVIAGFVRSPEISATLGAVVAAIVTAQRAFPFGQRAAFYRLLIGQADNLYTRLAQENCDRAQAIDTLCRLRMDFAQQLPRGSSSDAKPAGSTVSSPGSGDTQIETNIHDQDQEHR